MVPFRAERCSAIQAMPRSHCLNKPEISPPHYAPLPGSAPGRAIPQCGQPVRGDRGVHSHNARPFWINGPMLIFGMYGSGSSAQIGSISA